VPPLALLKKSLRRHVVYKLIPFWTDHKKVHLVIKKIYAALRVHPLLAVLVLSAGVRIIHLALNFPLWWDTHVYIGMGKYIFSGGQIGTWEPFRPLVLPLLNGAIWKAGLNQIIAGKVLDLVFSLIAIYLTYLIGSKIFNQKEALLGTLIFSLTPVFVDFTGIILTEPLAMVFGLLGVYLVIRNKTGLDLLLGGIMLGLSFLTKFPQGIWWAAILGAILIKMLLRKEKWGRSILEGTVISLGFIIAAAPYLIFNYYTYPNPLEPFISGSWIVTTATWMYGEGILFYLIHFFFFNPVYLFFLGYLYGFLRSNFKKKGSIRDENKTIIADSTNTKKQNGIRSILLICIFTIIYFTWLPRKEPRYLVTILPLMAMLAANAIFCTYYFIKSKPKPIIRPRAFIIIMGIILVLSSLPSIPVNKNISAAEQEIIGLIKMQQTEGPIISSTPFLFSYLDKQIIILGPMNEAAKVYEDNKNKFQFLVLNECDFICSPEDLECLRQREELLKLISSDNKEIYNERLVLFEHNEKLRQECIYRAYVPVTTDGLN